MLDTLAGGSWVRDAIGDPVAALETLAPALTQFDAARPKLYAADPTLQ
jgi:hypothetical protein